MKHNPKIRWGVFRQPCSSLSEDQMREFLIDLFDTYAEAVNCASKYKNSVIHWSHITKKSAGVEAAQEWR